MEKEVKLGDMVKDRVTNMEGIAVSRTEYLNGCIRFGVQQAMTTDGKVPDAHFADVEQLEVIAVSKVQVKRRPGGGDRKDPPPRP